VPADASVVFYYASLALSAAAVVLFLWLLREKPRSEDARHQKEGE
jgi:hypothetical protein